ncbi:MAG: DUF2723 domain-containing protein [bacterium]
MGKKLTGQKKETKGQKKKERRVSFKIPKFLRLKDEPIVPRAFSPIDYAGGILVFFICWTVYLHTLTPTIGFHDSGDMITAAYVLGIPHPTGYPLYCLLGKLWMTILPIGNIAYRMNLASALCASLACVMVYFIILKIGNGKWEVRSEENKFISHLSSLIPAIVGALMLAFAITFWEQAVIAEKYTLNALFATLLIFILLKWAEVVTTERGAWRTEGKTQNSKLKTQNYLYLFAFTLGLSFTHHMQTIYLVPASIFFIIAVYWKKWRQENPTRKPYYCLLSTDYSLLLKLLCLFILPLFLYLYLPIRAIDNSTYCYGKPDTVERFISHISGGEYKLRYLTPFSIENFIKEIIKYIISILPHQFTPYLTLSGLIGLFMFFRRKLLFILFSLIIITNISYGTQYRIPNIGDYYIISFLIFCILSGYGIREIAKLLVKKNIKSIIFTFLIIPIILFSTHYYSNNYNNYYLTYDYITNLLRPLKEKAIMVLKRGSDKVVFPLAYIQDVENQYPDIKPIIYVGMSDDYYIDFLKRKYPDLNLNFYQEKDTSKRFNNFIDNHITNYHIYTYSLEIFNNNYSLIPGIILYKVLKESVNMDEVWKEIISYHLINRNIYNGMINGRKPLGEIEKAIFNNYAELYCAQGGIYGNRGEYKKAIIHCQKALKLNPKCINAHYNLGVLYHRTGKQQQAIQEFKKAIELEPNNIEVKQMLDKITMQN